MSLLVDMMADTLDQGYAERAARTGRRRPTGPGPRSAPPQRLAAAARHPGRRAS
jgi:hypothetical protein